MSHIAPKVSVCIPTYDRAAYLKEAIESVLNQTLSDFELLIVDNDSKDNTGEIVKSFNDGRIQYYKNSRNIGVTRNWNRCIELAKGAYITIFHDDDVMLSENLSNKVQILDEHPEVGLVHSNTYDVDEKGNILRMSNWFAEQKEDCVLKGAQYFQQLFFVSNFICAPSVMVRKECFEKVGRFDDRLCFTTDWEMWMRISLFYDIAYLAEPLIKYRRHSGSATSHYVNTPYWVKAFYEARRIVITKYPDFVPNLGEAKTFIRKYHGKQGFWLSASSFKKGHYSAGFQYLTFTLKCLLNS